MNAYSSSAMNTQDKPNLRDMRVSYELGELNDDSAPSSPIELFEGWLADAVAHKLPEPNACTLSTIGLDGSPSARTVLLKGIDARGFGFYTNYESRKGKELAAHPRVAMTFLWTNRQRQVTVRGFVSKLPREDAEGYFAVRPYGHQVGAWASIQSKVIPNRDWLENRLVEMQQKFPEGTVVPCPENWGGYALQPDAVEFWQGRASRLHDRLHYHLVNGVWTLERQSP